MIRTQNGVPPPDTEEWKINPLPQPSIRCTPSYGLLVGSRALQATTGA